jgi:cation/acetate symporter
MATAADWMSAASFISMAGLIAFKGYDASIFLMGWTGGYVLLALCLAPYLRKFGKFTVPDFIGDRFYSSTARIVAVICLIVASLTYVIGQMKGIGVAFSRFLDVDYATGLYSGMAIVFFYAVLGGMKGVTYTQIAQYCVLIFAYTVPAVFISLNLTGNPLPQLGLIGDTADGTPLLLKLDQTLVDLGFAEYTAQKGGTFNMMMYTLSLMLGTAGLPHVIIRFFTVPKVSDARTSAGWALLFIAILYTTAPAVGSMARLNLTNTIQHGEVGDPQGNLVYEERPDWFKNWENTGLLQFEDKNGDGRIQYYNDGNAEFAAKAEAEYGWKGNEMVKVDRDIMVLANPEIAKLPDWVIALVAAGGLAAALSTAAGLLLAISTAISHDLLKRTFMTGISEKSELLSARIAMAGAILVAGYLGLNPPGFAAQVVALAFGLAASSIFPVLMMGIFSTKVNKEGAIAGMLAGLLSTLLYIFSYKGFLFIPGTELLANTPDNWFLGVSPEAFGALGALLNFVVAFVVSNMTAPVPDDIRQMVEDIRVPKGAGDAQDH